MTLYVSNGVVTTTFTITPTFTLALPPGNYTITANKPRYLSSSRVNVQVLSGQTVTLPPVALSAGDATGDGLVDARDLAIVGSTFGKSTGFDPSSDLNGDGVVNILDLVLGASNLGKCGAQTW